MWETLVLYCQDEEEWIMKISSFIQFGPQSGLVAGNYQIALDGEFFVPGWNGRQLAVHSWYWDTSIRSKALCKGKATMIKSTEKESYPLS